MYQCRECGQVYSYEVACGDTWGDDDVCTYCVLNRRLERI